MVHPIVFLTSFLNSATRKTNKMIYWKLKQLKYLVFLHIVCVLGGNGRVRLSEGMYRGVTEVKDNFFYVYSWIILPPPYFKQGLALQIWKNKINNLPYLCAVLCVCFCTGHFVMVPFNTSTLFKTFFLWTSIQFILVLLLLNLNLQCSRLRKRKLFFSKWS